jgi:hypothetical protein
MSDALPQTAAFFSPNHTYARPASNIKWSPISLGPAARNHKGAVSLGYVINLERAFGAYVPKDATSQTAVLVEFRESFTSTENEDAEHRLNHLVKTLRDMHESSSNEEPSKTTPTRSVNFSILKCLGWMRPEKTRMGLLFECPSAKNGRPLPLDERMGIDRRSRKNVPALGIRFDIAYGLAKVIADLVTIGWVHKEIRSANLIFFDPKAPRHFFLTGFAYSRANHFAQETSALPSHKSAYRWYRPQSYLDQLAQLDAGMPGNSRITSAVDVYALGVIMIELAFWDTADELQKDLYKTYNETGWNRYLERLEGRMGEIYTAVARGCLKLGDWAEDDENEQGFIAKALQELGRLKA